MPPRLLGPENIGRGHPRAEGPLEDPKSCIIRELAEVDPDRTGVGLGPSRASAEDSWPL